MAELTSWVVWPQAIAALLFVFAGVWLARWAQRSIGRLLDHQHLLDPTFRGILTALVRYAILLLAGIAALQQLGFQTASVLAAAGAVLVAVGLALQGTLSNIAAGIMLLWLRPFRVGDAIETASVSGKVMEVGLFATEIHRGDGVYVFVPNSDLWTKPVANLSRLPARMLEIKFTIKNMANVQSARERLLLIAASQEAVCKDPAPSVDAVAATDAGIVLSLTIWVDASRHKSTSNLLFERGAAALADL
jgi:small conductance mechanosensitive channel